MTILTLQPDATAGIDTLINNGNANNNYGIRTDFYTGGGATGVQHKMMVWFDVSSIPVGASITSAILTLYCVSELNSTDRDVTIRRAFTQWFEGNQNDAAMPGGTDGSTWNFRNANGSVAWGAAGGLAGTDYASSPNATDTTTIVGSGNYFDWDVTPDVQGFVLGTYPNYGWWLINVLMDANTQKNFATSDSATAAQRPELVIVYTFGIEGSISGTSVVQATLWGEAIIRGSASGIATVSGNLISNQIFGQASGTSTVVGDLSAQIHLTGSALGQSTVAGDITADANMAGLAEGVATVSGFGSFEGQMRGTASGFATTLSTLHVYARHVARAQGCYADPLLYITDGTIKDSGQLNRLDLINSVVGYILNKWRPTIVQYKEGGTWSESARGTGRRLTSRVFGNAIEVFELKVRSYNQNDLFQYTHEYFAWQEDAADFWTSDWASVPVYLVAKGPKESNPRYAIVYAMSIPELENPYEQPLYGIKNSAIEQVTLRLERGDWMSNPPGQSECVAISSARSWTIAGWSVGV